MCRTIADGALRFLERQIAGTVPPVGQHDPD